MAAGIDSDAALPTHLILPEELILLLTACGVPASRRLRCAIGGAGLIELLLAGRVRIEGWSRFGVQMKRFAIVDRSPTGDDAIDALVELYADLPNRNRLLYYTVPKIGDHFVRMCGNKLVARGVVDQVGGKPGALPFSLRDTSAAANLRSRVGMVLIDQVPADIRAVALAVVVHGAGLSRWVVPANDLAAAERTGRRLVRDTPALAALLKPAAAHEADLAEEVVTFARDVLDSVDFGGEGDDGGGSDNGGF